MLVCRCGRQSLAGLSMTVVSQVGRSLCRRSALGNRVVLMCKSPARVLLARTAHPEHVHLDTVCSGVMYTQAPRHGGAPFIVKDPRAVPSHDRPCPEGPHASRDGQPSSPCHGNARGSTHVDGDGFIHEYQLFPQAGDMVLFPSWLLHRVDEQGPGSTERIAWSFNVGGGVDAWARTAV
jgi:hypothetical protein